MVALTHPPFDVTGLIAVPILLVIFHLMARLADALWDYIHEKNYPSRDRKTGRLHAE